jgi:hypothetical protein
MVGFLREKDRSAGTRPVMGDIFLLDVVGEPERSRHRLMGTKIVAYVGRDGTASSWRRRTRRSRLRRTTPCTAKSARPGSPRATSVRLTGSAATFSGIANLPLATDGATVDIIFGRMSIDWAAEAFKKATSEG